jgi:hypothetical protein
VPASPPAASAAAARAPPAFPVAAPNTAGPIDPIQQSSVQPQQQNVPVLQAPQQQQQRPRVKLVIPGPVGQSAVQVPAGPAPVPSEGIDSFTQMLWDMRLGSSKPKNLASNGDYGQEKLIMP